MNRYFPEGQLLNNPDNRRYLSSYADIDRAFMEGKVLEAVAEMCDSQHNLIVNLGPMRGTIPHDEGAIGISSGETRDIALLSRVGKPVCFTITDIKTDRLGRRHAILSRRAAQEKATREYISRLLPGDIIDARITHLESFGAFCDIGCGIIALLPINSISVSRISHPRDRFSVGEDIKAVIKQVENGRITLTHKELLGTWDENAALFSQGETVSGIVRSVESYGVFVELTPNLAGLAEPKGDVYIGQTTSVYIKSIIRDKMKVKLIIIDSFDSDYSKEKNYFYEGDRIERWEYSPPEAGKRIVTDFVENL
ncbi:MAG: S1 RNA-binding domain-containing protein [Clostridia bacterium]|nr:S1 RNA-binding domain-containing protein [Oscillospiraceae bacterium]MBR6693875.1 S1 RNA-binding domain-containing protein [Clostridia bacterium]